jgi:hypothetical protein
MFVQHRPSNNSPVRSAASSSPPIAPPATSSVPPTTNTDEQFITLTKPVTIQVPYGTAVLPAGTKLQVLSRDSQSVDVRYLDARYTIPISSTNWQ